MRDTSLFVLLVPGLMLWLSSYNAVHAQTRPTSVSATCGVDNLTPEQAKALIKAANLALQRKRAARVPFSAITYVPICPHIVRQNDGTGGIDMGRLNDAMARTNRHFLNNGSGIQFYFAGTAPDYINNDELFSDFPYGDAPEADPYDLPNAMNQYYTNFISGGAGGYANFPGNTIRSTRSIIQASANMGIGEELGNSTIPHELGHNFSLYHTFGTTNTGSTDELVTRGAGANCATAGDLICDTPADPYKMPGVKLTVDIDGCPQYDPASTARDALGDLYMPSLSNIMSYWGACTRDFTAGQYDRMQAGLAYRQSQTAYTLDFPATSVIPASNLTAASNGVSVLLTWQDNANNEMGYFIERSTSPTTGFVTIGGVAPDVTTFRVGQTTPPTLYYYRVRPSNTTTGSLSPTASLVTPVVPLVTGLLTTNITGSAAQLNWNNAGEGAIYQVQWRPIGSANWSTIRDITETHTILSSLNTNTNYEWKVAVAGSTSYAGPVSFTTSCPVPQNLASNPVRISASLYWDGISNQTYAIQWRIAGTANWTTISSLTGTTVNTTTYYSLTGLASQTAYEWQVQGICPGSPAVSSGYSSPQSFTTGTCNLVFVSVGTIAAESVNFSWFISYSDPGTSAEVRYRPIGTVDWNTVSGLMGPDYKLTGLINNTTYEWQFKNICGASESSVYTSLSTFTTICRTPTGLTNTPTSKAAVLKWLVSASPDPATTYTVQYRQTGNPNWNTITGLTSFSCSLTGLTAGTSYEWHVLTQCTAQAQSGYSITKTFATGCNQLVSSNLKNLLVSSTSAQLAWSSVNDPDTHYTLLYRQVGAASWTTVSSLTASPTGGFYNLTGLPNNTTYEWQLSTICSDTQGETFIAGPTFTTQCLTPTNLFSTPRVSSASLSWKQMGLDVTYELNYRRVGESDFITLSNLTSNSLVLTGLISNTQYEWQVRGHCADGQTTDLPITQTYFTTYPCNIPSPDAVTQLTTTSAILNWGYSFPAGDISTEVRYRAVGMANWTTLQNLPSANFSGSVALTGLTPNTTYEWQIKSLCSPTESSIFSASAIFQIPAPCATMYTIQTGFWNDPAIWSCNRLPSKNDVVQIKHIVIIPASYVANAQQINFDSGQKLSFGTKAQLKIGL